MNIDYFTDYKLTGSLSKINGISSREIYNFEDKFWKEFSTSFIAFFYRLRALVIVHMHFSN